MDTTVALIFSLGVAFGGQDAAAAGIETTPAPVNKTTLTQRQHKVRQRIKLTNAWLRQQKQTRRALAEAKQRPASVQLARAQSCTADWDVV